jgi:hypothetical protein
MIPNIKNINKILKDAEKSGKDVTKDYKTGIVGEAMIVGAYKSFSLAQMLGLREILNDLIKEKKEKQRMKDSVDFPHQEA